MGRSPCCSKEGLNRGAWTALEDKILTSYIKANGEGKWRNLPKRAGLKRCGKSCRLRWLNYLRPDIKRGNISHDEEELIVRLHKLLGNRWSLIAGRLPGRTDNEIKNYWNTTLGKRSLAKKSSSSSSYSPPPPNDRSYPNSRAKRKIDSSTPNSLSRSPPPTATRPQVMRAKPNQSIRPPHFPPSSFPLPNKDQIDHFSTLPLMIPYPEEDTRQGGQEYCRLGSHLTANEDGHCPSGEVRQGCYIEDLAGFLDLGCENFGWDGGNNDSTAQDHHPPNDLMTDEHGMIENWMTYGAAGKGGIDMMDIDSLAFFLEDWP